MQMPFQRSVIIYKFLAVKVVFINKRLTAQALIKRSISNQNTVRPLAGK